MTPHNQAKPGQVAKKVIVCGDPLRARKMAERFLTEPKLINSIRNALAYTGIYKGKEVSIFSVGMGVPSMAIYSYELFHHYGAEQIIRVGTAGSLQKDVHVGDIVLAIGACSNSNYAALYDLPGTYSAIADFSLARKAWNLAREKKLSLQAGNILTSDFFYAPSDYAYKPWMEMGVLAVEMETSGLYFNAARAGKKALAILKISDSLVSEEEEMSTEQRENLEDVFELALELC